MEENLCLACVQYAAVHKLNIVYKISSVSPALNMRRALVDCFQIATIFLCFH